MIFLVFVYVVAGFFTYPHETNAIATIDAGIVLAFTNVERYYEGLPILNSNDKLTRVAYEKMKDLFARQYFEHVSPTGESVSDLAEGVKYEYIAVGENLALGDFTSSKDVVEAWMNSEGHRKNILSEKYTEIGIAAGKSEYQGRNTWIIVQSFGLPKSVCPVVDSSLQEELDSIEERLELYGRVAEIRREAAEDTDLPYEERVKKIETYNLVAKLYNNTAQMYRELVDEYNDEVGEFNECMKGYIADL